MKFMNQENQNGSGSCKSINKAKVDMMFLLMENDYLSKTERKWVEKFKEYYQKNNDLSKVQYTTLKDIFNRAASRVEWSRFKR